MVCVDDKEAFADLVIAPVFKTGEVSETMPGGFDSHPLPLPLLSARIRRLGDCWLAPKRLEKIAVVTLGGWRS